MVTFVQLASGMISARLALANFAHSRASNGRVLTDDETLQRGRGHAAGTLSASHFVIAALTSSGFSCAIQ
jgi:hypothetical protein